MINIDSVDPAVRTGEIDVFENAPCTFFLRYCHTHIRCDPVMRDRHNFPRLNIPDKLCIHRRDGTALGCKKVRIIPFSDTERFEAERIPCSDHLSWTVDHQRIRSLYLIHSPLHRFLRSSRIQPLSGDMICDHLRIDGSLKNCSGIFQLPAQFDGIDKISIMRNSQSSFHVVDHKRLGILNPGSSGCRIADMPHTEISFQFSDRALIKHIVYMPQPFP